MSRNKDVGILDPHGGSLERLESVIQEVGIWNPEGWNPESRWWNPESNTSVDSVTWGELCYIML